MAWCYECDRWFTTYEALEQHIENSAAHNEENYGCSNCGKTFVTEQSLHQHCSSASYHPYCVSCKRMFANENSLMQHMHSRIHVGSQMQCPFCKNGYATASGVIIHLESGTCSSGMNRQKINEAIRKLDRNHVITNKLLTMPGYGAETVATDRAWNGYAFECYFCPREFDSLRALNSHLKSPAHEQKLYRCPGKSCGREYKLLSGLVQHVESESCGLMRFSQVQRQAQKGINSMVGRMITG